MDARDYTASEVAAAAGDVPPAPIEAYANDDDVLILVDSHTARELATAWSVYHEQGKPPADRRPRWADDVVTLVAAAAHADLYAGTATVARNIADRFRIHVVPAGGGS